jgi:hypothetical protein
MERLIATQPQFDAQEPVCCWLRRACSEDAACEEKQRLRNLMPALWAENFDAKSRLGSAFELAGRRTCSR